MRRGFLALKISVILLVLFGGLFLRTERLNKQSYWMDEGYTINAVISQLQNGTDHLASILDSRERYFCPVYCLPTAAISQIFGEQPFSYRILSAIFGMVFIGIIFLFTDALFKNRWAAYLAAFLTTFSYWQIAWSRQARWYTALEVFFWLALLFFHHFLQASTTKRKISYLLLSILSTLLAIATQGISYLLPFLLLAWYLYEKRPAKRQLLYSLVGAGAFVLIAEFGLGLHFVVATIKSIQLKNNLSYYLFFYAKNYWPFLLITLYGFIQSKSEQRKKILFILAPFIIYLTAIATLTDIVQYRYLFHLTPIFYILASVVTIDSLAKIPNYFVQRGVLGIGILLYFISGHGVAAPKAFYDLEADDPAAQARSYYAYTPQSAFTPAYETIQKRIAPGEIVISSHPTFNKIFLKQPGYWLEYGYLGGTKADQPIKNKKEYYVGAETISSLGEIQALMAEKHGYVVFDRMSTDGRIPQDIIQYIKDNSGLIFYDERNSYSHIWVYRF